MSINAEHKYFLKGLQILLLKYVNILLPVAANYSKSLGNPSKSENAFGVIFVV